ncbi:type II toxin-antitoxin system PemK/MazF family toxin [Solwaraspora sp. WMMD406]|uniref:type II toxin-antitoxin system PemK/MazF family toxin n=1 Tax=Solwaraspora sp. WMMD406 TaxID=3016095 RepID=UPI0024174235|nr:type II toxin-antitoxin system PemK/MazF family toxin [Solwaraspora sp. WMMD406]MDG4763624.1 type II toxin-antitoxin system PemK/MazF family toxin [Solwaraspora sp. WMMD406]
MTTTNSLVINGGIYYVKDKAISLPPNDGRNYHDERRPVVVLSGPDTNSLAGWPTVLVAPISTSPKLKTQYCVKLGASEGGLPKKCWVRVVAVQPLLKSDLQDRLGVLSAERLEEIQARLSSTWVCTSRAWTTSS